MLVVIDNYDSFTYNLVQYFAELGQTVRVFLNDEISADAVVRLDPTHLVISPGPSTPDNAGATLSIIERCAGRTPILGVCLGHQAIAQVFGGRVVRADRVMHGKTSLVRHDGCGVFGGLANPLRATRYHSLVVDRESLPAALKVTAEAMSPDDASPEGGIDDSDGRAEIMGLRHETLGIEGVQFHPESFLTDSGKAMLANFLEKGGRP